MKWQIHVYEAVLVQMKSVLCIFLSFPKEGNVATVMEILKYTPVKARIIYHTKGCLSSLNYVFIVELNLNPSFLVYCLNVTT